jgi:hypothetical protein
MSERIPLSVCVMACDDDWVIERCLASVQWADEIVVAVDTKSHDRTEKIAREWATRVEVHRYEGDVEQKRWVTAQACNEWVLSIDSDEVVSPELAAEIQALFRAGSPQGAGFAVNRIAFHLGRWVRHGDWYPDWELRLLHMPRARWVGENPHGRAEVDGPVARLAGDLAHYSYRDVADQIDRIQLHSGEAARALHAQGRRARLTDVVLRPPARFLRSYVLRGGFLDGFVGFEVAAAIATSVLLKYTKLWELQRAARGQTEGAGG